ncbi:multidrug resistance protein 1, 2, 3 [Trichoderma asperelloides]|nr:multidrug resistance protein 1, 2, 3 [Trichoderma asperelloides]
MATLQLDSHERAILDRQLNGLETDGKKSNHVFVYATFLDKVILSISSLCAVIAGALNPLVPVIYGLPVGVFDGFTAGNVTADELRSKISTFSLYYVYLAIALFGFSYVFTVGFYYSGERIARALRTAYLSAIMRQNMAFFDLLGPGEITNCIMSDMGVVQEAVTSKLSVMLTAVAQFCATFVIAFIMYWKMALIITPFFVTMTVVGSVGGAYVVKHHKKAMAIYGQASVLAEEAISAISHVTAFGIQPLLSRRYLSALDQAAKADTKAENTVSAIIAWSNTMPCLIYALSFWADSKFLVKGEVSVAEVTTTNLAVTIGSFPIARIAPSAQALTSGIAIAGTVLKGIARQSPQDPLSAGGEEPEGVVGDIQLEDIGMVYPSRDEVKILNGVTLTCPAMQKTAIVGPSGSGKSSILGLIERFYEPTSGKVLLDSRDIQLLNLGWLRRHVAIVNQNPILFSASIFENIQYGCSEMLSQLSTAEVYERVTEASKKTNAHDFIMMLPDGYETQVSEKGLQLSGGQRQRIAIARALIKDPKILLLDEATSALDSKSEAVVQTALDAAAEHRTTIIVAHRLSTIRNADNIIVLAEGRVVEQGKHEELIAEKAFIQHWCSSNKLRMNRSSIAGMAAESGNSSQRLSAKHTLAFIGNMAKDDWKVLLLGMICAILAGLGIPVQSIFFAKLLTAFGLPPAQYAHLQDEVKLWSGLYVAMAGAAFIFWMAVGIKLSYVTKQLARGVRDACFKSIMTQVMAFFDEAKNAPSALSSLLSKSTNDLAGMGGPVIGGILTFISTIIASIVLSLAVGWKLALVCTATIPVMLSAFDSKIRQSGLDSAAYSGELVRSVRTVASLVLEKYSLARYDGFLAKPAAKSLRSILSASSLYAASQSLVYLCSALAFWYGGTLIADEEYTTFQFYIYFVSLISGSQIAGSIFTFAPDASKAMHASDELQRILNARPSINNKAWSRPSADETQLKEKQNLETSSTCQIHFDNVPFAYPSRPNRRALDGLSVTIKLGQTPALVGQSGSGKSTCISLLERFYDPDHGRLHINGQDIRDLDVDEYRRTISLVSQETIVFSGTIRENVAIGLAENDDVLAACREANILEFVESLPEGLSTPVGTGGSMLSGGQKQRIAIARAFLRKPKVLLLDEATSALETESETIVQAAMDAVRKGRTTIMVAAHRLRTVVNADIICVLQDGALLEMGSHEQLMERREKYWEMVGMQALH